MKSGYPTFVFISWGGLSSIPTAKMALLSCRNVDAGDSWAEIFAVFVFSRVIAPLNILFGSLSLFDFYIGFWFDIAIDGVL